jgi:Tol biopolymer transport system component
MKLKNSTLLHWSKKLSLALGLTLTVAGCLPSCQSGPNPVGGRTIELPSGFENLKPQAITDLGQNRSPAIDEKGQFLYFVSSERMDHMVPQAYRMAMSVSGKSGAKAQRLTYQNGEVLQIIPRPKGRGIVYTSTTDEDKEDPAFVREGLAKHRGQASPVPGSPPPESQPLPATEIYSADLEGDKIERLTKDPGFDGDLSLTPEFPDGVFAHLAAGAPATASSKIKGLMSSHATLASGTALRFPIYMNLTTAKGRTSKTLFYVRTLETADKSADKKPEWQIVSVEAGKKDVVVRHQSSHPILNLVARPGSSQILFAENVSTVASDPNYEIFVLSLDTKCLQRLTYNSSDDVEPALHPDGKQLFWASRRTGQFQIYQMDLTALPACKFL